MTLPHPSPVDPARHRATIASIYSSLPAELQIDALTIIENWPRMIHSLACAGQLTAPDAGLGAAHALMSEC